MGVTNSEFSAELCMGSEIRNYLLSTGGHTNCVTVCSFKIIRECMRKPKGLK